MALRDQLWVRYDRILHDNSIYGMDSDYVSALACLHNKIWSFDFSSFANKDTAPLPQHALANALFIEIVQDMEDGSTL